MSKKVCKSTIKYTKVTYDAIIVCDGRDGGEVDELHEWLTKMGDPYWEGDPSGIYIGDNDDPLHLEAGDLLIHLPDGSFTKCIASKIHEHYDLEFV